jgi:membrane-associated phospholipid phosphatase
MPSHLYPDPRRAYLAAGVALALVWPALFVDLPIARWVLTDPLPGDIRRLVHFSEVFAHGLGVAVIVITVFVLDARNRWQIPRLLASAYLPGMMANSCKLLMARVRPGQFDLNLSISDSFVGWLPTVHGVPTGIDYGYAVQSLPSGHTATTVGLAVGLSRIYPQGRWLFAVLAMLAAFQRIYSSAHYLSDTLVGAAIGLFGAALVADPRLLGRWLDRLEGRLQNQVANTDAQTID